MVSDISAWAFSRGIGGGGQCTEVFEARHLSSMMCPRGLVCVGWLSGVVN